MERPLTKWASDTVIGTERPGNASSALGITIDFMVDSLRYESIQSAVSDLAAPVPGGNTQNRTDRAAAMAQVAENPNAAGGPTA